MKKLGKIYEFPVIIEKEEDSSFFASAPTLPGCYTSGNSFEEALSNIKDAINLYVTELKASRRAIPKRKTASFVSVEVAA